MLAIVALAAPLNWITRRVIARDPDAGDARPLPPRARRRMVGGGARRRASGRARRRSPTRSTSSTFPIRARKATLDAVLDGLRLLAIANALAHGLLAPGRANWRLVNLSDRAAALIERLWLGGRGDPRRRAAAGAGGRRARLAQYRRRRPRGRRDARRAVPRRDAEAAGRRGGRDRRAPPGRRRAPLSPGRWRG